MNRPGPSWEAIKEKAAAWLLEGISPQRLALTLALGFALGCIPVVGVPTGLCAVVALSFRLNLPAIQAANYAAMPFQLALIVPLVRLGGKLTPSSLAHPALDLSILAHSPLQLITHSSAQILSQLGILAGQALLAWVLMAIPVVAVLTIALTGVLRRVPAIAAAQPRG
ncbi:MAG TPA: DUF2062 domain-containing protein [Terracidiphilus sp.]|jgi:hypothetical protein|nr:DUF2062 domain-containing protein [Terracidiphilus sp.]